MPAKKIKDIRLEDLFNPADMSELMKYVNQALFDAGNAVQSFGQAAGQLAQTLKQSEAQAMSDQEFSVTCVFDGLPANTKVSARSVRNVDLSERGGFALLGDFVSNYDGSGVLQAHSDVPLVVSISVQQDENKPPHRAAVLIIPSTPEVTTKIPPVEKARMEVKFQSFHYKVKISVTGGGIVYGSYKDTQNNGVVRAVSNEALLSPIRSQNVYYQVALDLEDLNRVKIVNFKTNQGILMVRDVKTTLHENTLPVLPNGFKWGPEIGGIVTVQRITDPYQLYLIDVLLDFFHDQELSATEFPELFNFIKDQALRLEQASKMYKTIQKMYFKSID